MNGIDLKNNKGNNNMFGSDIFSNMSNTKMEADTLNFRAKGFINKPLRNGIGDQRDFGSIGMSDKSSFGSDSNDSNGDFHSGMNESVLSSVNHLVKSNDLFAKSIRDSTESPAAFFGFSLSNSSSPPLSQTSNPSSSSSFSDPVTTSAIKFNQLANNSVVANSFNKQTGNSLTFVKAPYSPENKSQPFFGNTENSVFDSSAIYDKVFGSTISDNTFKANHPLDNSFSTLMNSNLNGFTPAVDFSKFSGQSTNDSHSSFSQDSLPLFLQNSTSLSNGAVSSTNTFTSFSNKDKSSSLFPVKSINSDTLSGTSTSILSLADTPNNTIFQNGLHESTSLLNNNNMIRLTNANMQAKLDAHMRFIANDINTTFQLYLNAVMMRKEQLMKQMDHIKSAYMIMLAQNKGNPAEQLPYQMITFTRPEQSLLKSITSLGSLHSPAFAPYCVASGEGLKMCVEGEPVCFGIAVKNCFNEPVVTGKIEFIFCLC